MNTKTFTYIVGTLAVLVVGSILFHPDQQYGTSASAGSDTGGIVSRMKATELYAEYDKNEVAADDRFKGQHVIVSGSVKDIGKDITGTPYLLLGENLQNPWGTQVLFDRDAAGVAQLTKGRYVDVRCTVAGMAVKNVILRRCTLQ